MNYAAAKPGPSGIESIDLGGILAAGAMVLGIGYVLYRAFKKKPVETSGSTPADLESLAAFALRLKGVSSVQIDPMVGAPADANGAFVRSTGQIFIREGLPTRTQFQALTHEIAHVILHNNQDDAQPLFAKEVEAELVAYLVSSRLGILTDYADMPYVVDLMSAGIAAPVEKERVQKATAIILSALQENPS